MAIRRRGGGSRVTKATARLRAKREQRAAPKPAPRRQAPKPAPRREAPKPAPTKRAVTRATERLRAKRQNTPAPAPVKRSAPAPAKQDAPKYYTPTPTRRATPRPTTPSPVPTIRRATPSPTPAAPVIRQANPRPTPGPSRNYRTPTPPRTPIPTPTGIPAPAPRPGVVSGPVRPAPGAAPTAPTAPVRTAPAPPTGLPVPPLPPRPQQPRPLPIGQQPGAPLPPGASPIQTPIPNDPALDKPKYITPTPNQTGQGRAPVDALVDYDALIANDPEYQFLLSQLEAAMKNAEADFGAESANVNAQTLARLQQLQELTPKALEASNNDFAGRGLGFSGGFLEDQGRITRESEAQRRGYEDEGKGRLAALQRQLDRVRGETGRGKQGAFINVGEKVRGRPIANPIVPIPNADLNAPPSYMQPPSIVSPVASPRNVTIGGQNMNVGGVLAGSNFRRRRTR